MQMKEMGNKQLLTKAIGDMVKPILEDTETTVSDIPWLVRLKRLKKPSIYLKLTLVGLGGEEVQSFFIPLWCSANNFKEYKKDQEFKVVDYLENDLRQEYLKRYLDLAQDMLIADLGLAGYEIDETSGMTLNGNSFEIHIKGIIPHSRSK